MIQPSLRSPADQGLKQFKGEVLEVSDADTFVIKHYSHAHRVRLHYVDAPEIAHNKREVSQPLGPEAASFARQRWAGHTVIVKVKGKSYDRYVADVFDEDSGESLAMVLVTKGYAQVDPRFHPPADLQAAQKVAVEKGVGVWSLEKPIPPWEWRRLKEGKAKDGT